MMFQVISTLLLLNFTTSPFFAGQNGSFNIEINQKTRPSSVFVDFGDDSFLDSKWESMDFFSKNDSSVVAIYHTYQYVGSYDVYFKLSNNASSFEHRYLVIVEDKISGVKLVLLSPNPVVALFENVTVQCIAAKGSNLEFKWDFGDQTDGLYTTEEKPKQEILPIVRTAYHSYGIANSYNVSVLIFNQYESVRAFLNVTIQAVELIEQLHLEPVRGRFSAPLYRIKRNMQSTTSIEFEAYIWRGSDVQFLFDFGDGNLKHVPAHLNTFSHLSATVKHSYTSEGIYKVLVVATNLLSSVNESLNQPFYVQFPPEDLMLDRQYYIIEHYENLTLNATLSQGTNVSFNWRVDNLFFQDAGNSLMLPQLNPGIYVITVEAYNHVTDFGYNSYKRVNTTAKVYIQEKLLDIQICIRVNNSELCELQSIDLSLDEEIEFHAKVVPSTETALQFLWELGTGEIRRINMPFFFYKYQEAGLYTINATAQNHISCISSLPMQLNLIQKVANLTSIFCQGPNLVNYPITYRALYWFGTHLTFCWNFGDGSEPVLTSSPSIQHIYKEVGEYWVSVNVWNKFSHAMITTNMFFLHQMCRKPEINFLHKQSRIVQYDEDILLEADISIICESTNVEYTWILKDSNQIVDFNSTTTALHQRTLIIQKKFLHPGVYDVYFKVNMVGTIVYSVSSTTLVVLESTPVVLIKGGFVRWLGLEDSQVIMTNVFPVSNITQALNFEWSCTPLILRHYPCFKNSDFLKLFNSSNLFIPSSSLIPHLGAVVLNVTVRNDKVLSASQVLEIKQVQHMLQVDIACDTCHDHRVNQQDRIYMKALCKNCSSSLKYFWRIWILEENKLRMHFSNYECVQADGSTFFIIAPNSTMNTNFSDTYKHSGNIQSVSLNVSDENIFYEYPYEDVSEDFPPFPVLPGFSEDNIIKGLKFVRYAREAVNDKLRETLNSIPYEYPVEEDAFYEDNVTFKEFPNLDFQPFPNADKPHRNPDYLITEEGIPGEGGSAAARHQSLPNLGILTENEDNILEGTGTPRMKSAGNTNVLVDGAQSSFDPLRNKANRKSLIPHIISRSRSILNFNRNDSATGFNSEYLVLKSGLLKVGRSYLVQAKVVDPENNLEGFAMEYLQVNVGPVDGRCTLMPIEGFSISFDFRLHCFEWKSNNLPLFYELHYSKKKNDIGHLVYFGLNQNVKFNLPVGSVSDSYNVYLNVVIRDSSGTSTKVCSLIRKVMPVYTNITMEQFIYNETFHTRAHIKKLVGEKNTQAVLQKIHVLVSTLNNQYPTSVMNCDRRREIRQRFFQIIDDLIILSKVEAVQVISVLSEIIADISITNTIELQNAYDIFKKINFAQSELYDFFASDLLHTKSINFLAKLAFAAHAIRPQNNALIDIAKIELMHTLKDCLKRRLKVENPLKINVFHLSAAALYITEKNLLLKPSVTLKKTAIQFLDNTLFVSKHFNQHSKRCSGCKYIENCLMFIAHEYDYTTLPEQNQNLDNSFAYFKSSVQIYLNSCHSTEHVDKVEKYDLNISVSFSRITRHHNIAEIYLKKNYMNIHAINITEKDIGYYLFFYAQFDDRNGTNISFAVDVMFRFQKYPTLKEYDLKLSFSGMISEVSIFISQAHLKAPGLYYIGILNSHFQNMVNSVNRDLQIYKASVWKDLCFGKESNMWSPHKCLVAETSTSHSIHCHCSSKEITVDSVPLDWELIRVPISHLIKPYFNPLSLISFIILLLLYFILLYFNIQKDKKIHLYTSPVPLRDNCDKHKQFYLITVKTGFDLSSGTTASVFLVLHGVWDVTETRQLIGQDANKFSFQKGSVDMFLLSTERNLGPLLKLEVWHNNQGSSPSWYLKTISVKDLNTGGIYYFDCYNWLCVENEDGLIERELLISGNVHKFKDMLYENFLICIHDLNMWNALVNDSPASFFTGAQRITCCFCFLLNCTAFFFPSQNESDGMLEDYFFPQITSKIYITPFLAALVATLPQIFFTILLRFSHHPFINISPNLKMLQDWFSLYDLMNCWLKPKQATSSQSTHNRSSSMLSNSNSLYSSFDDSSIKSVPDLQVEEQSFSDKEMNILPHSISYPNISIAMSPLQKTLSTWQNLENWLHRKQDIILKSDLISIKRHSFVLKGSSIFFHEHSFLNIDANNSMENSSLGLHSSSLSLSQHSNSDDPSSSEDFITNLQELGLSFYFPCLHPFFFYLGWFLMLTNIVAIYINLLFKAARHSTSFNFTLLKGIIISSVSSILFITPFIIFLISVPWSIYFYNQNQKFSNNDDISLSTKKKDLHKIDYYSSSYRRIEYFKKYLRPPKEAILEQFRQVAVHEKIILNFYRNIWMHVSLLILLLGAAMSKDVQMKYLQRNSIENSLFQSLHLHIHWIPSKHMLLNWIELDFMDKFISEQRCLPIDKDCGISTQCILVGNVILRHFYNISTLSSYSNETKNMNFGEMYERRHLKGYYSSYFVEDEWEALTDDNFYTYDQMQTFVNKLKTSSAASIEMLLFNPTFQDYISVSILFEKAQAEAIAFSYEIFSFTLYSRLYYPKVFLNSMLFICVLFSCKNQLWKMLKQGHLYWRYLTNYFNCFFIIMCFIYLAFFVLYIHICKRISFRLIKTQLNSNINITELLFVETCVNVLSGLLVFMHLYKFLRVFCFNPRLERIYKRLIHSQKLVLSTFLSFIIIVFASCALLNLTGTNFILSYPLYSFIKGINLSLKNYSKTEIKVIQGVFQNALAVFAAILVIFIHFYTFTVIKSILLNTKCSYVNMKNSNITLKQMSQVLKKKLSQYFRSETPQIISQENHVPPIEILLLELEKLTDTLVSKAENMFPERTVSLNQIDLESDFHSQKVHPVRISKMKFELNDLNKHNWQEKLMLTIPHSCKKEHNAILPISLQSSLKLGKTLNIFESPSVLQSNRIRRTYPLCYFNSNSSESEFHSETTEQEEALFDNSLLIRRTKSRGKFNGNFDCSYENLNQELKYSSSIQE